MVGITISNEVNMADKHVSISFRRKDQLTSEVIWSVLGKVAQSNNRFNALDKLIMTVQMPIGNGRGIPTKGRPLSTMAHLKRSIVSQSGKQLSGPRLSDTIAKLTNDPDYVAY
jgi:hypothetical protein